ncbi:MAG: siroheme synthase CysG [Pseudomonadota bacterium]
MPKVVSRKPSRAPRARVAPLATLPVFLPLEGKRVVLAGGSEAAAWKAELLAASGAHVEVYAADLSDEMSALVTNGASAGSITRHSRPWSGDCLAHAGLAVCDAETDGEAQAFSCAARAAGVPVNVIDKPAFCQFQFGSIVNRSPVVIGISTHGAAPILGQAIRRRIETLLPLSFQGWAQLGARIRGRVLEQFPMGAPRRAFWERFVDHAFSGNPAPDDGDALFDAPETAATGTGRVTLVGAGPGDAEYLTLKAVRALQSADVILFDDLVSDEVLELARREAKRMMVGKRGRRASCRQDDINALMIKLARQGKHVVRLKSGDPMVFGRAGEELDALDAAGVPAAVVPGVTAASAMAARLAASLTHRDHAQSVTFVTGHARNGRLPQSVDVAALAKPDQSVVVYMGGGTSAELADALVGAGADEARPCVAVRSLSRANEAVWSGTLGCLMRDGIEAALPGEGPVLLGIGAAFGVAKDVAVAAPLAVAG